METRNRRGKQQFKKLLALVLAVTMIPCMSPQTVSAKGKTMVNKVAITKPSKSAITLNEGKTYQLKVKITPANAADKKVSYKSSDSKVVTVSSKGKLTAKKRGTAKITVTSKDGSKKKDTLKVTVKQPVTKVAITTPSTSKLVLKKGASYNIKTKIAPANANNKKLTFHTSKKSAATVDAKGKIKAKKSGTAVITVKSTDGSNKKDKITVTVGTPVSSVTVAKKTVSAETGSTYRMNASVKPAKASVKTLNYKSSDTKLATVDKNGTVKLLAAGKVTITATAADGSKKSAATVITITKKATASAPQVTPQPTPKPEPQPEEITTPEGYQLMWQDEFNGTALNMNDWSYELHDPGWVNNELQAYVESDQNVYVKDGKLVIQALKSIDEDGKASYTSGRINTQNKHDFTYGRFETRAKVPAGQGFLPAFWMMPTDESLYGQWPKCGELDIMEVLGSQTDTAYGTLHFGEPHTQKQGAYTLDNGDFASEYHTYACEWDPDEIRFYVDGYMYYKTSDWFTKRDGFGEIAYPAPYDQPFYMILNLAVGGTWPGNPDETTGFAENAQLSVDYVRVYQKTEGYDDSNVEKPETVVELRDPDATGNYVINGEFAEQESLSDTFGWGFLLAGTGEASATITDNMLTINTMNAGKLDYSVQVVQPNIPMQQGKRYRLSFDAYATENRTLITDITAPDNGYIRYLTDTMVQLGTEKQNYSYEFNMTAASDKNGRVEFNLGNQPSTADVFITNVRVEQIGEAEIPEEVKSVLSDGNYVYNGEFQEGSGRLAYWTVENHCAGAEVKVTNKNNVRELRATVPTTVSNEQDVQLKQDVAITGGKEYRLSFEAYADAEKTMKVSVGGQEYEAKLATSRKNYTFSVQTAEKMNGSELVFSLNMPGVTYIDNVRLQEEGMIINGDFSNGLVGFEKFVDGSASAAISVDALSNNNNNAACMDIANTGDADWKIQLKQNGIKLENGKWYKISFDARSTMDRKIMYALQRDGSSDDNWIPYSGTQVIDLTADYQSYTTTFCMTEETDQKTILSISAGAVGGEQIATQHSVYIDNIVLEETTDPGADLITNGNFASGAEGWENAITAPGAASATFENNKATYEISNVGDEDWNVQLKQNNLTLEQGAVYTVSCKITSTATRIMKMAFLSPKNNYDWYGGQDIELTAGVTKEVSFDLNVEKATDSGISLNLSMGKIAGTETPASTITIENVSVVKK